MNKNIQELNIGILNQKIKDIMQSRGLSQEQLAGKINMSQPNFSRAINNRGGKCFTLNQIFMLSQVLEISIDELTGSREMKTDKKEIASMIAELVLNETAKFHPVTLQETVYIPIPEQINPSTGNATTTYQALYFPNYWQPKESSGVFDEPDDSYYEAIYSGNFTDNALLNVFLDKLKTISDAYFADKLDRDDVDTLIKKHIEKI